MPIPHRGMIHAMRMTLAALSAQLFVQWQILSRMCLISGGRKVSEPSLRDIQLGKIMSAIASMHSVLCVDFSLCDESGSEMLCFCRISSMSDKEDTRLMNLTSVSYIR